MKNPKVIPRNRASGKLYPAINGIIPKIKLSAKTNMAINIKTSKVLVKKILLLASYLKKGIIYINTVTIIKKEGLLCKKSCLYFS